MFHLIDTPNGPLWRCESFERLGVMHGFSTRAHHVGLGEAGRVVIGRLAGVDPSRVVLSRQVHGATVTRDVDPGGAEACEADGHVMTGALPEAGLIPGAGVVAVRTADCVPVLLATASGGAVAAVHAGWRGLEAGVITEAVRALREAAGSGGRTVRVLAAVGPCISAAAYEVGEEVASRFRAAYPGAVRDGVGVKPHLDLRAVARQQLFAAGLAASDIAVHPGCTFTDAAGFHSYRREGKGVGHQAAWIGVPIA